MSVFDNNPPAYEEISLFPHPNEESNLANIYQKHREHKMFLDAQTKYLKRLENDSQSWIKPDDLDKIFFHIDVLGVHARLKDIDNDLFGCTDKIIINQVHGMKNFLILLQEDIESLRNRLINRRKRFQIKSTVTKWYNSVYQNTDDYYSLMVFVRENFSLFEKASDPFVLDQKSIHLLKSNLADIMRQRLIKELVVHDSHQGFKDLYVNYVNTSSLSVLASTNTLEIVQKLFPQYQPVYLHKASIYFDENTKTGSKHQNKLKEIFMECVEKDCTSFDRIHCTFSQHLDIAKIKLSTSTKVCVIL